MATEAVQELTQGVDTDTLLRWYHDMLLIRRFEDRAEQGYQEGKIAGYHHVYSGQEAVAVGTFAHLGPEDHIITAYRDHGPALARGISARAAMAELYGKATGTSKGKGGSMHLAQRDLHFWGGYAIVGAHLALGTGIALAEKYRGTASVTVCMFGDGASNNGYFHEALNLAAVWQLPILFLCENNLYGMWTPFEDVSAVRDVYKRAPAYGIPARQISDGMNVQTVHDEMREAIEHIRSGNGPYFVEVHTYRYRGHGAGDIEKYRTKDEVASYREKDPISQMGRFLLEQGTEQAKLDEIAAQVDATIADAVEFAANSPEPTLDQLWTDIYARPFPDSNSPSKGRS